MALTWYRHFQRNGGLNQILEEKEAKSILIAHIYITAYLPGLAQTPKRSGGVKLLLWVKPALLVKCVVHTCVDMPMLT